METTKCIFNDIVIGEEGLLKGPFGSDLKKELYVPKGEDTYKVYLQENILKQNNIAGEHYISKDYYEKSMKRYAVKEGDFIVTCDGTLGEIFQLKNLTEPGIISSSLLRITLDKKKCDEKFFPYFFKAKMKMPLITQANNSVLKHLPGLTNIRNFAIDLPLLATQKKIASVLSALDDKISLNKKMNQKLEVMAKRLYDYWFVQFDFPDKNGRPYKTTGGPMTYNPTIKREIPQGWEVLPIGEILDKYKNTKKYNTSDYKTNGKYPIVDQDTSTFIAGYTDDEDVLKRFPAVLFGDHSTCVKFLNFEFGRGADGTQILYSKNERIHQFYLYMAIKSMSIPNPGYARHFKFLKEMPIILPCQKLADEYQKRMEPIYTAITKVDLESRAIMRLRDKLLPLLMNGQVEVK